MRLLRHPAVMWAALLLLGGIAAWDYGLLRLPLAGDTVGSPPQGAASGPSASDTAPASAVVDARTSKAIDAQESAGLLTRLDPSLLQEIVERPLFTASRRPPPKPAPPSAKPAAAPTSPPPPAPSAPPSNFRLLGIVSGEQRIAIVLDSSTGRTERLQEGMTVGSWTVTRIEPVRVELKHKAWTVDLSLFQVKK